MPHPLLDFGFCPPRTGIPILQARTYVVPDLLPHYAESIRYLKRIWAIALLGVPQLRFIAARLELETTYATRANYVEYGIGLHASTIRNTCDHLIGYFPTDI